jgi:hypothetical protein
MKLTFIVPLLSALILAGCNKSATTADELVGTYGAVDSKTGQVASFVKIESSTTKKGGYVLYEQGNDGWRRPVKPWDASKSFEPVGPFTAADLEKAVNHKVTVDVNGVQVPGFALVHVPAGWSDNGTSHSFTTRTGYFAITLLGPVDLVRMETH